MGKLRTNPAHLQCPYNIRVYLCLSKLFSAETIVFSMFRCPDVTPIPTLAFLSVFTPTQHAAAGWRGGLVVGRRTCDLVGPSRGF